MMADGPQDAADNVSDGSSAAGPQAIGLDVDHPWPGLAAYDEASRDFFHGRGREARELLRLIRLAPLTLLYSKSGLGKSSLLQAGLFPLLREHHLLPVYVRIDFSDRATDPLVQVARRLDEELARAEAEYPPRDDGETLWEYLHREPLEIWSKDNFPIVPVLVFDQFEEIFSHRRDDPEPARKLRDRLADLIENRIPAEFATEAAKPERSRLNLLGQGYRIVLSCREDFLPDLKSWERDVPSLLRNCLRLEPMTRECAIEAVEKAGGAILADGVAPAIVDFVGKIDASTNRNGEIAIEPVLLCLSCYQLNRRRKDGKITQALIDLAGEDILDDFYRTALSDKDVRGSPDAATFIESHLVQGDRFRGSYPRVEAIEDRLITQPQLDALTDRYRLLRVVQYSDTARIELIHDRLVEVVCRARDARRLAEQRAEAERKFREQRAEADRKFRRRLYAIGGAMALVLLAFGVFAYMNFIEWERSRAWATLDSAISGRRHHLREDVANIGRPTEAVRDLIYQVPLRRNEVSRIHLMVFRNSYAVDARSLFGTTVNGKFLPYSRQMLLNDGDVVVLGGVAAFVFRPLTYRPWQFFWRTPLADKSPLKGWAVLIDSRRRQIFPLTRDEVFIAPAGDDGVEPSERSEGAIAVVRRREVAGPVEIDRSIAKVDLFERRPEDTGKAEVFLFAFAAPGATNHRVDFTRGSWLTIEDVADGQALEADIKLDDYAYGRFVMPEAQQYFDLRSPRGVRDHSLTELAFHQGQRRFQVLLVDPRVEDDPREDRR